MLMVILGAGASFDSSADFPASRGGERDMRPPLANDLFDRRYSATRDRYPQFNGVLAELVPQVGRSIEDALQRLESESEKNPRRKVQLAAIRYYLSELLATVPDNWAKYANGPSNYAALIDQINSHRTDSSSVCLVTFNYDTLLESVLTRELRYSFTDIADYVSHKEFKLFKLHGSTNWSHVVNSMAGDYRPGDLGHMIRNVQGLKISNQFVITKQFDGIAYPAIAVPTSTKYSFECPPDHLTHLSSLIPKVTKVLTIGWRGMEGHFLRLLENLPQVDLVTVGGTIADAEFTQSQLRSSGMQITSAYSYAGFSEVVANRNLENFLSK